VRSDWVSDEITEVILVAMMPVNALVLRTARATGLRISDVLQLKTEQLRSGSRFTIKEQKTGKRKRVYIPADLRLRLLRIAGRVWVFEHRTDWRKHRTRQAVNKDMARAVKAFRRNGRVPRGQRVSPHSMRKAYAVEMLDRTGDVREVQKQLNHGKVETTMIYAMSREVQRKGAKKRGKSKGKS